MAGHIVQNWNTIWPSVISMAEKIRQLRLFMVYKNGRQFTCSELQVRDCIESGLSIRVQKIPTHSKRQRLANI